MSLWRRLVQVVAQLNRAIRHFDVEVGFDDVIAAGEFVPRSFLVVRVDDQRAGAFAVDVERDAVEALAGRVPHRVDGDVVAIGGGDRHAPGSSLTVRVIRSVSSAARAGAAPKVTIETTATATARWRIGALTKGSGKAFILKGEI